MTPPIGRRQCRNRRCARFVPGKGKTGKRPEFCNTTCRRKERAARDQDAGRGYVSTGQPTVRPWLRTIKVGERHGELVLAEYLPSDSHGSRARFACDCGNDHEAAVRNVVSGATTHCPEALAHPPASDRGEALSISAWHQRLSRSRGRASSLPCVLCSLVTPGNQWAYRHSSSEARTQLAGKDRGQVFSLDEDDYWVLCRSHHQRWDRAHARTVPVGATSLVHVALAMAYDPDYESARDSDE